MSKYAFFCRKLSKYVLWAKKMAASALRADSTLSPTLMSSKYWNPIHEKSATHISFPQFRIWGTSLTGVWRPPNPTVSLRKGRIKFLLLDNSAIWGDFKFTQNLQSFQVQTLAWTELWEIADVAQAEYCTTFHCSSVRPSVCHRRDISLFSHI